MVPLGNYGATWRPTPSAKKSRKVKFTHIKGMDRDYKVSCKICGFYADTKRDSKCPFCESERYNK